MNRGLFETQLNTAGKILVSLGLDLYRVWHPDYCSVSASNFKGLTYLEVWRKCVENQLYNFLLDDHSLIQFRVDCYNPLRVGYAYLECPYVCASYKDFVEKEMGLDIDYVGDELISGYEQYASGCSLKHMVTPIRYDYAPELYQEGTHPASHIHFGHGNHIRIGTRKMLVKPLSFLLLIIRQCYLNKWFGLLENRQSPVWCKNVRKNLDDVDARYWGPRDQYEMVLH